MSCENTLPKETSEQCPTSNLRGNRDSSNVAPVPAFNIKLISTPELLILLVEKQANSSSLRLTLHL